MKRLLPIIIVIIFGALSVRPILSSGFFPMHDDTQVARVITMGKALGEGQFPVRMVSDLGYGYGYPIYNFYGPLPYYFGGILYALGVPAVLATKSMIVFGVLAPAVTMYAVLSGILGISAAAVAALFMIYAPYHAVQVYVRGAVGEFWILMFWPLILYGFLLRSKKNDSLPRLFTGAIGIAGSVLAHTLLGYVTVLAIGFMLTVEWIVRIFGKKFDPALFARQAQTLVLGLGLSAFFWLPAVVEMGYTNVAGQIGETARYMDHFVCPVQYWSSEWGFGGSAPGCIDGMSYMLGKLHIAASLVAVVLWLVFRQKEGKFIAVLGTVLSLAGIFFASTYSAFFWGVIPGFAYLQYPWRFLAVSMFGMSLLTGLAVRSIKNTAVALIVTVGLGAGVMIFNMKWFVPQYTYQKSDSDFENISDMRWRVSNISDEYLPRDIPRPENESEALFDTIAGSETLKVTRLRETAVAADYVLEASVSADVIVRKAYFPGTRYVINNNEIHPKIEHGLPVIALAAGQSVLEIRLTDTPIRLAANALSLASLLWCTVLLYERQRKIKR